MSKGVLAIVSGFSGAGKGTLMRELLSRYSEYSLSISATTRKPREGEVDGREYFFKTKEEFEELIRQDALIEYAQYVENYYGTPKEYVQKQLDAGKNVILEIEMQGAMEVKKKFPHTVLLFITPPTAEDLRKRLVHRGTETMEQIEARLSRAVEESDYMNKYDFLVINEEGKISECVEKVHNIIQAHRMSCYRKQSTIEDIQEDLKKFKKGE